MALPVRLASRRRVLTLGAVAAAVAAVPLSVAWAGTKLRRTPDQILGPFWPTEAVPEHSGDLTRPSGRPGRAAGQVLHVSGRVLNTDGVPVSGAKLEIWQANSFGRYRHPSDTNPAPLDPNFDGYTELVTDADGRYRFTTVKPGGYPVGPNTVRPPHIHFDVSGRVNRLVTQMYFEGEPDNSRDRWLQSSSRPEALIVALQPPSKDWEPDSRLVAFDIVLLQG
jgi:protocatechuate 3,4-dioxygenase, beta subunit